MPELEGSRQATVTNNFFVVVREFKFDRIRQESYWTTNNRLCKQCKSKQAADAYASRVLQGLDKSSNI